jgi:hypothetical protein
MIEFSTQTVASNNEDKFFIEFVKNKTLKNKYFSDIEQKY